ncbi:protein extra-macrochaetae [Harmonia axyridis]|uniref:protein extra-macrochaetae n=1 Tax=Harmonia axyridis TaxID=115357 RepID=UPI001E278C4D|nr:protein extra-macrochaetae [Harmonia axyridis]
MKAIVSALCNENSATNGVSSGKVSKARKDVENEEIQMYLSKLKDLVPFMPKNRKLSKLEVIQYVIDYICDLQSALETHPAVNAFDATAALSQKKSQAAASPRQPLGVRSSPNTILGPCEASILTNITSPEKMSSQERSVSC